MSYWLVGDSPNDASVDKPETWLTPDDSGMMSPANRLLRDTGWTSDQYLAVFSTRTFVWAHPRRLWIEEGRHNAAVIAERSMRENALGIVVLGERAAKPFWLESAQPLEWIGRYAVVPYCTGRCQYWKVPGAKEKASAFFADLAARAGLH